MFNFKKTIAKLLDYKVLHADFETRSVVDLKKYGTYVYSMHPSTDAWCMAWAFDDEPVQMWRIGEPLPDEARAWVMNGGTVTGHNVSFEWHIWNNVMRRKYGWPVLKVSQLDCTMARAYAMALPGSLKMLAKALRIERQKDMGGHALMLKMSKPRKIMDDGTIIWWDDADKFDRLCAYCATDVEVERDCAKELYPLSDSERALWQLDLRINSRGIKVDRPAIKATQRLVEREMRRLDRQMNTATNGEIQRVNQAKALLEWCKSYDINIETLRKNEIKDILEMPDLPWAVREALEIRSNAAKVSVSKLDAMMNMSLADGRIHGQFQYHGASTGRAAGRGVQVHNLPRPEDEWGDPAFQDRIITAITNGEIDEEYIAEWHGPFMRVVSSCIRGYLVADEGKELIGADLKSIEGVTLPWLAGEEWKLEAFREHFWNNGAGIYQLSAARIFDRRVEECGKGTPFYLLGKVGELSMGYQGGKGAFAQMAANYGVKVEDEKCEEVKNGWRAAHPKIKQYWYDVEDAAIQACLNPGGRFYAGAKGRQVCFRVVGEHLMCRLPSGRPLVYPYPTLKDAPVPWGGTKLQLEIMTMDNRVGSKTKGQFVRQSTYGGKLVENITQAVARDVLFESQPRLEKAGYPIILHVHDENVSEVPLGYGSVEEYEAIMSIVPHWAKDMPIAADGFRGKRYRK